VPHVGPARQNAGVEFTFEAELWRWPGNAAWHFVSLPIDAADEIEDRYGTSGGFGAVKVDVRIGATEWSTSIFPDSKSGTYVLPVKRQVRDREGIADGDVATVTVSPVTPAT